MKIGILSDTHDLKAGMDRALAVFAEQGVGLVLHCGDWIRPEMLAYCLERCASLGMRLAGVLGNNDVVLAQIIREHSDLLGNRALAEDVLTLEVSGRKLAVCHGHRKDLLEDIVQGGEYDAVFTGHTHRPQVTAFGDTLVVNPGSCAFELPRTTENITTVAVYDADANSADIIEL